MNNSITMNRTFKIIGLGWAILISVIALTSCGGGPQKKDAKESAEDHNDAKFASNSSENDAQYLVDAYSIGLYEIEASQHAKQKASRNDVKDLASEMIEAHAKMNESLKSFAGKNQVSLQQNLTEEQMKEIKDCGDKKGVEYDKAYLKKMIEGHEKAIKMSEEAAEKAHDPEIRNLFSSTLPSLRHHLEMAMSIKDKMK
jgi:putative membrane protein